MNYTVSNKKNEEYLCFMFSVGTITRNAFEDQRSPMFHVRKFLGSTKNAVLSAMKIPPQNLVIPSNYEIKNINPEEIEEEEDNMVSGINPKILSRSSFKNSDSGEESDNEYSSDPYGIVETFARIGGAIRDSVRSGKLQKVLFNNKIRIPFQGISMKDLVIRISGSKMLVHLYFLSFFIS